MTIKVEYRLFDKNEDKEPIILGIEAYSKIKELLIPEFDIKKNTIITRYFDGQPFHRWLIKSILANQNKVIIFVVQKDSSDEVFLSQTLKKPGYKSINSLLRLGTVVEVDFGFRYTVYKKDCDKKYSSKRYPNVLQQHELYKRRPALVLKATGRGVQVIPLTSQKPRDLQTNSAVFELSEKSLKCCPTLNQKKSYVLSHLIQTVDYSRILPPLSILRSSNSQRLDTYQVRITPEDKQKLSQALANNVGFSDYYEQKLKLNEIKDEKEALNAEIISLKEDIDELKKTKQTLWDLLSYEYVRNGTCEKLSVDTKIDSEIKEYAQLI